MADNNNIMTAMLLANQRQLGAQADPADKSRRLAQLLMSNNDSFTKTPVQSVPEGIARALTTGIEGFTQGYVQNKAEEKQRNSIQGLMDYSNATTDEQRAAAQEKLKDADPMMVAALVGQKMSDDRAARIGTRNFNALGDPTAPPTAPGVAAGGTGTGPLSINITPNPAPTEPAPDQAGFIQTMTPHALAISQATGLDPRLVLAQTALETGYGKSAPGNNYFGIKGPGQVQATTEAGPGGALVPTQDSFRTYGSPAESAQGYIDLMKDPRYAGVVGAQGLDAQVAALGKSGYATDPNYAAKVGAIAKGLPPMLPDGTPVTDQAAIERTASGAPVDRSIPPPPFMQQQPQVAQAGGVPVTPAPAAASPTATPTAASNLPAISPSAAALEKQAQAAFAGGDHAAAIKLREKAIETQAAWTQERAKTNAEQTYKQAESDREFQRNEAAKPLTEFQGKSAAYADRMHLNNRILDQIDTTGTSGKGRFFESVPVVGDLAQTQQYRTFQTAKDNWIAANLRQESGAAIGRKEYNDADKQYFPQVGDGPDVIKQKAELRKSATEAMARSAGDKYKLPAAPSVTAPAAGERPPLSSFQR